MNQRAGLETDQVNFFEKCHGGFSCSCSAAHSPPENAGAQQTETEAAGKETSIVAQLVSVVSDMETVNLQQRKCDTSCLFDLSCQLACKSSIGGLVNRS